MPAKCTPELHQLIQKIGKDTYCSQCSTEVNPDAVVHPHCERSHRVQKSRGAMYCYDCGKPL